jgi:hypothetical protein
MDFVELHAVPAFKLLEPDGAAVLLPGGGDFWSELMSGNATDPGIRRLIGSAAAEREH